MSTSKEFPDSGDSGFAKVEIPENTNFALYSGHVIEKEKFWLEYSKWKDSNNYSDEHHEVMLAKKYL